MEGQSELSELSVISWVSAVEGCPLSGVPLYIHCICGQYTINIIRSSNSFSRSTTVGAKLKFMFQFCSTVVLPYEISHFVFTISSILT